MKKRLLALLLCASLVGCAAPAADPAKTDAPLATATPSPEIQATGEPAVFAPGAYTAASPGIFGDDVAVTVSVDEHSILSIEVEENETLGFGDRAIASLREAIVDSQSLNVDMVTGATASSAAFLTAVQSALTQAGADIASLQSAPCQQYPAYEDTQADVVIVGAGGAGMLAAIELREAGKNIILLEKQGIVGGNTLRASTNITCCDTVLHKQSDMDTSVEGLVGILQHLAPACDPAAAQLVAENSKYVVDLAIQGGGDLANLASSGYSVLTSDGGAPGLQVVEGLRNDMDKLEVDYRLNNRATKILIEDGKACGVEVSTPAGNYTIRAEVVLLASGGYAASQELIERYAPEWAGMGTTNAIYMTGDGQIMAEEAGAALKNMEQFSINPTAYNNGFSLISFTALRNACGAIMVNKQGERFTNETQNMYTNMTKDVLQQEDKLVYLVFDQTALDSTALVRHYHDLGYFLESDTLEGLAGLMGVNPAGLTSTIEQYQKYVDSGVDEAFGRDAMVCRFDTPKYYAAKVEPALHGTYGGVAVDLNSQALDPQGNPIPGLYAAGCVADMNMSSLNATVFVPCSFAHAAVQHILGK